MYYRTINIRYFYHSKVPKKVYPPKNYNITYILVVIVLLYYIYLFLK